MIRYDTRRGREVCELHIAREKSGRGGTLGRAIWAGSRGVVVGRERADDGAPQGVLAKPALGNFALIAAPARHSRARARARRVFTRAARPEWLRSRPPPLRSSAQPPARRER